VPIGGLSGHNVGVAADRRAGEQIAMLERRGAEVLHGAAIRTHPVSLDGDLAGPRRTDPPVA
jgi:uroporphyrinogen-III synthase